jgi:hypothetical protein
VVLSFTVKLGRLPNMVRPAGAIQENGVRANTFLAHQVVACETFVRSPMAFSGPLVFDSHLQDTKQFAPRFAKAVGAVLPAAGPVRCWMLLLPSVIAPESVGASDQKMWALRFLVSERCRQ